MIALSFSRNPGHLPAEFPDPDERSAALAALEEPGVEPVLFERPAPDGYSATEAEYREALRCGLRIGVWATSEPMDGRQQDFLRALQVFDTTGTYADPVDLRRQISARLRTLAAEACSPWCKIGPAVFRAHTVRNSPSSGSRPGATRM